MPTEIRLLIEQGGAKKVARAADHVLGPGDDEILTPGVTRVYVRVDGGEWYHKSFDNYLSVKHTTAADRRSYTRRAIDAVSNAIARGDDPTTWAKAAPPK